MSNKKLLVAKLLLISQGVGFKMLNFKVTGASTPAVDVLLSDTSFVKWTFDYSKSGNYTECSFLSTNTMASGALIPAKSVQLPNASFSMWVFDSVFLLCCCMFLFPLVFLRRCAFCFRVALRPFCVFIKVFLRIFILVKAFRRRFIYLSFICYNMPIVSGQPISNSYISGWPYLFVCLTRLLDYCLSPLVHFYVYREVLLFIFMSFFYGLLRSHNVCLTTGRSSITFSNMVRSVMLIKSFIIFFLVVLSPNATGYVYTIPLLVVYIAFLKFSDLFLFKVLFIRGVAFSIFPPSEYSSGYCYLRLFAAKDRLLASSVGSFPSLRQVLVIYATVYAIDIPGIVGSDLSVLASPITLFGIPMSLFIFLKSLIVYIPSFNDGSRNALNEPLMDSLLDADLSSIDMDGHNILGGTNLADVEEPAGVVRTIPRNIVLRGQPPPAGLFIRYSESVVSGLMIGHFYDNDSILPLCNLLSLNFDVLIGMLLPTSGATFSSLYSADNTGYCYLQLLPYRFRYDASVHLGRFPSVSSLTSFAREYDCLKWESNCKVTGVSTLHVTLCDMHITTIESLAGLYGLSSVVGGTSSSFKTFLTTPREFSVSLVSFLFCSALALLLCLVLSLPLLGYTADNQYLLYLLYFFRLALVCVFIFWVFSLISYFSTKVCQIIYLSTNDGKFILPDHYPYVGSRPILFNNDMSLRPRIDNCDTLLNRFVGSPAGEVFTGEYVFDSSPLSDDFGKTVARFRNPVEIHHQMHNFSDGKFSNITGLDHPNKYNKNTLAEHGDFFDGDRFGDVLIAERDAAVTIPLPVPPAVNDQNNNNNNNGDAGGGGEADAGSDDEVNVVGNRGNRNRRRNRRGVNLPGINAGADPNPNRPIIGMDTGITHIPDRYGQIPDAGLLDGHHALVPNHSLADTVRYGNVDAFPSDMRFVRGFYGETPLIKVLPGSDGRLPVLDSWFDNVVVVPPVVAVPEVVNDYDAIFDENGVNGIVGQADDIDSVGAEENNGDIIPCQAPISHTRKVPCLDFVSTLKLFPTILDTGKVLTRSYDAKSFTVPCTLPLDDLNYFRNNSSDQPIVDPNWSSPIPLIDMTMKILRCKLVKSIGAGQRVLVINDDVTNYPVEGFVGCVNGDTVGSNLNLSEMFLNVREANSRRLFYELDTRSIYELPNNEYTAMVIVFAEYMKLEYIMLAACRARITQVYILTAVSASSFSDNLSCHLNTQQMVNKGKDNLGIDMIEFVDSPSYKLNYAVYLKNWLEYVTVNKVSVGLTNYSATKEMVLSDVMLSHFVAGGFASAPTKLRLLLEGKDSFCLVHVPEPAKTTNNFLHVTRAMTVIVAPTQVLEPILGQFQKQKQANRQLLRVTKSYMETGENKAVHPALKNTFSRSNESINLVSAIGALEQVEALLNNDVAAFDNFFLRSLVYTDILQFKVAKMEYCNLFFRSSSTATVNMAHLSVPTSLLTEYEARDNQVTMRYCTQAEVISGGRSYLHGGKSSVLDPWALWDDSYLNGETGKLFYTVNGTFVESIFYNPQLFLVNGGISFSSQLEAFSKISQKVKFIVINDNKTFFSSKCMERCVDNDFLVIRHSSGVFVREKAGTFTAEKFYEQLIRQGFHELLSDNPSTLMIISNFSMVSQPQGFCFYKACGISDIAALAGTDKYCTPTKIRDICRKLKIIIIKNSELFIPENCTKESVKQCVVVVGTHAFQININLVIPFYDSFVIRPVGSFTSNVNGSIDFEHEFTDSDVENLADDTKFNISPGKTAYLVMENNEELNRLQKVAASLALKLEVETSYRKKSVIEFVMGTMKGHINLLSKMELIRNITAPNYLRALADASVYDWRRHEFLGGKRLPGAAYAWTGKQLVNVNWMPLLNGGCYKLSKVVTQMLDEAGVDFIVVSRDEKFLRDKEIVTTYMNNQELFDDYSYEDLVIKCKNGVPGCGKTFSITEEHNMSTDLVCTQTLSGKKEYDIALSTRRGYKPERYRTYDSILVNPKTVPKSYNLLADEGFMVHFGQLLMVAVLAGVRAIEISGDTVQIKFISRVLGWIPKYHEPDLAAADIIPITVTRRLPIDITNMMSCVYPKITTTSKVVGSLRIVKITTTPIITEPHDLIMTFTQGEKTDVANINSKHDAEVSTIHEKQGATTLNAALIRTRAQNNPIYSSLAHIIVGVTRHKMSFTYYTVDDDDLTCKLLRGQLTHQQILDSYHIEKLPSNEYNLGNPSSKYDVLKFGKMSDRMGMQFVQWLLTLLPLVGMFMTIITGIRYQAPYAFQEYEARYVSKEEVNTVLEMLYTPNNYEKQAAMKNENPLPVGDNYMLDYGKLCIAWSKTNVIEMLTPELKTVQPDLYRGELASLFAAIEKRNSNPPKINLDRPRILIEETIDIFMKTYVDEDAFEQLDEMYSYGNMYTFSEWLSKRSKQQLDKMKNLRPELGDPNRFSALLKAVHKASLDNSQNDNLVSGQIIAVHHPLTSAYFSEPIKTFSERLKHCMKKEFIVNDGYNLDELNGQVNECLYEFTKIAFLEIDMSKFDKSQDEFILELNCELMKRFGVRQAVVDEWRDCHTTTKLHFVSQGISIKTLFQRKSGDVFTFIGNTVTTMLVLAFCYDLSKALMGAFGGDDSLIAFSEDTIIFDQSKQIQETFNLEAKIEIFPGSHYFSSKFLIQSAGCWMMVPDPIKLIAKLGRDDLYCREHVEEYYISFCDNYKYFKCALIRNQLATMIVDRYNKKLNVKTADAHVLVDFLATLLNYKEDFLNLYQGPDHLLRRKLRKDLRDKLRKRELILDDFEDFDALSLI